VTPLRRGLILAIACATLVGPGALPARAQSNPTYVPFDPFTTKGVLYRPDGRHDPEIAILLIHRVNNYLGHLAGIELSRRGFLVLAMNSRFDNNEASVVWELIALDVKNGIDYLRRQSGVRKIVLFGHSGGGATLSFYQAVAEKGPAYCNAPQRLTVCGGELKNLPRADGLILADASLGNPVGLLRGLNPAVISEGDPKAIDASLDPFSPTNGFNPGGRSTYTPEFKQRYHAAQSARMNRLIDRATAQASQLGTDRATFPDDNLVFIVRAQGARLDDLDNSDELSTLKPRKLLKNNGSISTEIVTSVRPPSQPNPAANATFSAARVLTLRSFLTANAIRSSNSMTAVDWCSSNNSTPCALGQITVPLLVSAMGAGTGIRDNEWLFEQAASRDKDFFVLEGATHNFEPCLDCETRKGQYNNCVKNYFNYLKDWITRRFSEPER
jgi:pimeloyl-ACP methyl ester carboxylesterase